MMTVCLKAKKGEWRRRRRTMQWAKRRLLPLSRSSCRVYCEEISTSTYLSTNKIDTKPSVKKKKNNNKRDKSSSLKEIEAHIHVYGSVETTTYSASVRLSYKKFWAPKVSPCSSSCCCSYEWSRRSTSKARGPPPPRIGKFGQPLERFGKISGRKKVVSFSFAFLLWEEPKCRGEKRGEKFWFKAKDAV